jgi:Zn-dependent metalloprotease
VLAFGFPFAVTAAPGGNGAKSIDPVLVEKLKNGARGSVTISINEATDFATFIVSGRNGDLLPQDRNQPNGKAKGFLKQYGGLLGVADADSDLVETATTTDQLGATHVTYEQRYRGLPVYGGILKVHVDAGGDLTAVNGTIVPGIGLDTNPTLSADQAAATAIAAVVADPPGESDDGQAKLKARDLRAEKNQLLVYRTGLIKGEPGTNELAYEVVVTNGANVRDAVFVHAQTGNVINRYTLVDNALFRRLFEQNTSTQVWQEGDPFPGALNGDQQNIVTFSGHAYHHFLNAFGRDSYDGAGAEMKSVNNDPRINCPNANWNGLTTNYCNGVTADDIVAHEWGHAYTEFTDNLIYQWQPGALNESYSDIWGETVDMINGAGTDSPSPVRTVGSCSAFSGPRVVVINSPASIAQTCPAQTAQFGPPVMGTGVTGDVVLANDGIAPTSDACTALPAGSMTGKVGLVDRGTCGFAVKVKIAQDAGAIAVVVANSATGVFGPMGGVDPTITVSSLMISFAHGNAIKGELGSNTVNVTLKQNPPAGSENSLRWLMGEDSTAFGGAIRDMWTPTCMNDPGKVTDAQYHCLTTDGGGVHTNSGVPNHGYALLVDGGTYNGQTITGLGLVKAAPIYWRAQSIYQLPTSKFADHADALEASCTDLIGQPLNNLSTGAPGGVSGQTISAADCAEVADMIAAVELRTDPAQCNFQPLLKQNPPSLCANQKNPPIHYEEDFEDGLAGWTLTNTGVYSGWPGLDWTQSTTLPGGRSGAAAFAVDPDGGNCDQGAGDISGVMRLQSPAIVLPNAAQLSPRLTFEHYVATEAGFDGGNLRISVNGGTFDLVPASAFNFNPYNATLAAAPQNTNPLQGQPAFTGTDGGEVHGSWGQSQIDLTKLGIKAGDTIQLRFDFGMDGCAGVDGWYVDDIQIQSCNLKKKP